MTKKNLIILGAGFGGVETARTLRNNKDFNVTIISAKPYFEYYPGLYRVLSSEPPFEVFVPLKKLLPDPIVFLQATVTTISFTKKEVVLENNKILAYDYLVIALGSEAFYFNTPGIEKYALSCKSLVDARYLRRDILSKINRVYDNGSPLHIVIAGGGPTGVETAGQVASLLKEESHFHDVDSKKLLLTLVQGGPRILSQVNESIAKKVEERLKKLGVSVLVNTKITGQNESAVLTDKETIETDSLIWTAGSQMNSVLQKIKEIPLSPKKKIVVDEYLKMKDFENVFVIGDNADTLYSGLAQTAAHDGFYVGSYLNRISCGKTAKKYTPPITAYVMPVGRYWGVFVYKNFFITGIIPHVMRYLVDISYFLTRLSLKDFLTLYLRGKLR